MLIYNPNDIFLLVKDQLNDINSSVEWSTLGIVFTVLSTVAGLTWWLSGQFSTLKSLMLEKIGLSAKIITEKIEYHERHDDDRFSQIREDLSELRIRNAAKDALMTTMIAKLDKMNGK